MTQQNEKAPSLCGRVRAAYKAFKHKKITQGDNLAAAKAFGEEGKLPVVRAVQMTMEDVMETFQLEYAPTLHRRHWMEPPHRACLTHRFSDAMRQLDRITRKSSNNTGAARARVKLLLTKVCAILDERRGKGAKPLYLQTENTHPCESITYIQNPYRAGDIPDQTLWYGPQKDTSCNFVVVETTNPEIFDAGPPQLLAYMAMIHQKRLHEDKNNCTVYGICTNYRHYYFFEIDNESKLWTLLISKCNYWPEHIANIIAEFAHQAALLSSAHAGVNSKAYHLPVFAAPVVPYLDEEDEMIE